MRTEIECLEDVEIASPCPADWRLMKGDAHVRLCALCKLNVYNLSSMTRFAALELVRRTEGRVCVRLLRRADGTVITADCPIGQSFVEAWERIAERAKGTHWRLPATVIASVVVALVGVTSLFGNNIRELFADNMSGALAGNPNASNTGRTPASLNTDRFAVPVEVDREDIRVTR